MKRIRWWLKPGHHTTPAMVYQRRHWWIDGPILIYTRPFTYATADQILTEIRRLNEKMRSK